MKKQNNIHENSENELSFLDKFEKKNNFLTPDNYFKELPQVVSNNILNNNNLKFSFDKLSWRVLLPTLSFIVLFIVVFNFFIPTEESTLNNEEISEVIINESYTEIDDYLVYELYSEILDEVENTNSDADEYIDYLVENDIDINAIIEEL